MVGMLGFLVISKVSDYLDSSIESDGSKMG
jgi:hypothetical protein